MNKIAISMLLALLSIPVIANDSNPYNLTIFNEDNSQPSKPSKGSLTDKNIKTSGKVNDQKTTIDNSIAEAAKSPTSPAQNSKNTSLTSTSLTKQKAEIVRVDGTLYDKSTKEARTTSQTARRYKKDLSKRIDKAVATANKKNRDRPIR